jgi:hypothetical protein
VTGTGEQRSRKRVKRGGGVGAGRAEEREGFGQCGQGSGNLAKTKGRATRKEAGALASSLWPPFARGESPFLSFLDGI